MNDQRHWTDEMARFTPQGLHNKAGGRASRTPGKRPTPDAPTLKVLHKFGGMLDAILCNPFRVDNGAFRFSQGTLRDPGLCCATASR